jgi:hypothetical protein
MLRPLGWPLVLKNQSPIDMPDPPYKELPQSILGWNRLSATPRGKIDPNIDPDIDPDTNRHLTVDAGRKRP